MAYWLKSLKASLLNNLLSDFRFYRRLKGGVWYKVGDPGGGGMSGSAEYWTQYPPPEDGLYTSVTKKEEYGVTIKMPEK